MSIQIYILDASGNLEPQWDLFRKSAMSAFRKVQEELAVDNVDIVIKEAEIPEVYKDIDGIGGSCPSECLVQLNIDINRPSFKRSPGKHIEHTLFHELHHAARMQAGVPMGKSSFLEYLFSEGLADNFVYELTGDVGKWIPELNAEDKKRLKRRAKRKYGKRFTREDHAIWFVKRLGETANTSICWLCNWVRYCEEFSKKKSE